MVARVGVIGGTGFSEWVKIVGALSERVRTRYGDVKVGRGETAGREVVFLPRHGLGHRMPPHLINYKANIAAFKKLGVRAVFATAAAGSLKPDYPPGSLLVIDQFVDFCRCRPLSFFEEPHHPVVHVDMTQPYCPTLRQLLIEAAAESNLQLLERGCYFCLDGPRYETMAEVKMMAQLGGDVVGMTSATEAILCREAEICYAVVVVVTNFGAGLSEHPPNHFEVEERMSQAADSLRQLFAAAIARYTGGDCPCRHALDAYKDVEVEV